MGDQVIGSYWGGAIGSEDTSLTPSQGWMGSEEILESEIIPPQCTIYREGNRVQHSLR